MAKMEFKWLSVREIVPPTATKTVYTYADYRDWNLIPAGASYGLSVCVEGGNNYNTVHAGRCSRKRVYQGKEGYIEIPWR